MDYLSWNKSIFKYFFNNENALSNVLFCVDRTAIIDIAEQNGIPKEKALDDFLNAVTLKLIRGNKLTFGYINNRSLYDGIPYATSAIALFILAASDMKADEQFSQKNYYSRLTELINTQCSNIVASSFYGEEKEMYFNMFETFADYVNNTLNGALGLIEFKKLFKKEGAKRDDLIGIPIFQAMINRNDKALLTEFFAKETSVNFMLSRVDYERRFSPAFRMVLNNAEYRPILESKVNLLYDDWDGIVYELYKHQRKVKQSCLTPTILYKRDNWRRFVFYRIFKRIEENRRIAVNGILLETKNQFPKIYDPILISTDEIFVDDYRCQPQDIKVRNIRQDYRLFKNSVEYEGYLEEVHRAFVGDVISVVAKKSFFKNYMSTFNRIFDNENLEPQYIDDIVVLEDVKICNAYSWFNIFKDDKISFKKGLRQENTNIYLQGAEPIIVFEENEKSVSLDGRSIQVDGKLDLRFVEKAGTIGQHKITTINNARHYEIVDFIESDKEDLIIKKDVFAHNVYEESQENVIIGCFIENYKPKAEELKPVQVQEPKQKYLPSAKKIEMILRSIKKKYERKGLRMNPTIEKMYFRKLGVK